MGVNCMKKSVRIISVLVIVIMIVSMTAVTAFAAQVGTFGITAGGGSTCNLSSTSQTVTYSGNLTNGGSGVVVLRFSNSSTFRSFTFICDGRRYTKDFSLPAGHYTVTVIAGDANFKQLTGVFEN